MVILAVMFGLRLEMVCEAVLVSLSKSESVAVTEHTTESPGIAPDVDKSNIELEPTEFPPMDQSYVVVGISSGSTIIAEQFNTSSL